MKNIWGWKVSFIAMGVILATGLSIVIFDVQPPAEILKPNQQVHDRLSEKTDTTTTSVKE